MSQSALVAADVIAIAVLVFALYFPRYGRRDMVVAILGLNIGVLAVATTLSTAQVSAGLGLGLFGVLSIIRLRSSELEQEEVAYYFTALALGLLGGISVAPAWVSPALMSIIVLAMYIGDHPRLFASSRHQVVTLDQAIMDERILVARLESVLGGTVIRLKVKKVDLVNDSTVVDVRFRTHDTPAVLNDTHVGTQAAAGAMAGRR